MSRFQALTNAVLDAELDRLRARLGLEPNQKAELLREMAAIAGWVARLALSDAEIRRNRSLHRGITVNHPR
ncbi:MAG: hypothetical protein MUC53_01345 [Candidatus Contendobacter sp.]|jgi:hypothetical protein|nr:hypothetical protein [Candidatus Contendobacter sp.]